MINLKIDKNFDNWINRNNQDTFFNQNQANIKYFFCR